MPGIFGIVEKKQSGNNSCETVLNTMADQLCHQKWYKKEQYQHNHIGLGSVSINSPFPLKKLSHQDKEYIVVIDGYIYSIPHEQASRCNIPPDDVPEMLLNHFISSKLMLKFLLFYHLDSKYFTFHSLIFCDFQECAGLIEANCVLCI